MKGIFASIVFLVAFLSCEDKNERSVYDLGKLEYELLKIEEIRELSNSVEIDNLNSSSESINNLEVPSKLYLSYQYTTPLFEESLNPTLVNIPQYTPGGVLSNMTKNKYEFGMNHSENIESDDTYKFQVIVPGKEKYRVEIINNGISIEGKFKASLNGPESKTIEGKWNSVQFSNYTIIIKNQNQQIVSQNNVDVVDVF